MFEKYRIYDHSMVYTYSLIDLLDDSLDQLIMAINIHIGQFAGR